MVPGEEEADNEVLTGVHVAGALRGALIGVARTVTRPAQMKVFIWLMKRKWKQGKVPHMNAMPAMVVEGAIGTLMYDVYERMGHVIQEEGTVPLYCGQYGTAMAAGSVAGLTCATFSTVYNNIVQSHVDSAKTAMSARRMGNIALTGKHSVFKGMRRAALTDTIAIGVMFSSSKWYKNNLPQPPPDSLFHTTAQAAVSGGLAGMTSSFVAVLFQNSRNWATQYAGSHIFALSRRIGFWNTLIAGLPPAVLAAFIPNAIGMGAFTLALALNKHIDTYDEPESKAKSA